MRIYTCLILSALILGGCFCNHDDSGRNYVGESKGECELTRYKCPSSDKPFSDESDCGCEPLEEGGIYCKSRVNDINECSKQLNPVCGWNDPDKIQCITYPCAQSFSNECRACADSNVVYWTPGECA